MTLDPMRTVTMAVQVVPLDSDLFATVDHAIGAIAATGVKHEVGPMETVMEGGLDELLAAAKAAHLACFDAGASRVMTYIKIGDDLRGTTIEEKMTKHRRLAAKPPTR